MNLFYYFQFIVSCLRHFCWSALATAPTSASAGAKVASNSTEFVVLFVSNHRTTTSRQPRKLKFGMEASFNPTRRNIKIYF